MSEELPEPAVVDPTTFGSEDEEPVNVPGEAPATDAPGAKIYVCPACGTRYDEPTECTNGHAAAQTVEYDRATFEKAAAGDADAIASVNETATAAAGNVAGVVPTEATPAAVAVPVPAAAVTGVSYPTATAPGDAAAIAAGTPAANPTAVAPGAAPGVAPGAAPAPISPAAPGAAVSSPDVATAPGAIPGATTATPDGIGGTPASAMTPDGVHPNLAAITAALAQLEAAIAAARTAFGIGG